jgi:AcrR family transcriptional regulator
VTEHAPKWTRRKEARPQEIMDAAIDAFVASGYAETRLTDVAARAGVVKGTIYRYFATKDDLFRAVARHLVADMLETIDTPPDAPARDLATLVPLILQGAATKLSDARVAGIVRMVLLEGRLFPDLAAVWHDEVIVRVAGALMKGLERPDADGNATEGDARLYLFSLMGPMLAGVLFRDTFPGSPFAPDLHALAAQHATLLRTGFNGSVPTNTLSSR